MHHQLFTHFYSTDSVTTMMRCTALLSVASTLCCSSFASAFSVNIRPSAARSGQDVSLSLAPKNDDDNADDAAPDGTRRLLFAAGGFAAAAALAPPNTNVALAASGPYAPAPGSMDGKIVVITGGNTGK